MSDNTNPQSSESTTSWLLEGAPAALLSHLQTTDPATTEQAAANKAAMMKMAGAWKDLTDGLAHDHADVVKELGCKWFGDEAFGEALERVIRGEEE